MRQGRGTSQLSAWLGFGWRGCFSCSENWCPGKSGEDPEILEDPRGEGPGTVGSPWHIPKDSLENSAVIQRGSGFPWLAAIWLIAGNDVLIGSVSPSLLLPYLSILDILSPTGWVSEDPTLMPKVTEIMTLVSWSLADRDKCLSVFSASRLLGLTSPNPLLVASGENN